MAVLLSSGLMLMGQDPGAKAKPKEGDVFANLRPAPGDDEGLVSLKLLMASGKLKEAKGGPTQGFYLELENKTGSDLQVALAFPAQHDLLAAIAKKKQEGDFVRGWWKLEPGTKRRVFVDHGLSPEYFLHARNAKNYWGKDRQFLVPCGVFEKAFIFTAHATAQKCVLDENGCVVCSHSFTE